MTHNGDPLQQLVSTVSAVIMHSLWLPSIENKSSTTVSFLTSGPIANPHSSAWCHLLVLRRKNKYSKQMLAIITQTSDCHISIVNTIEKIAIFTLNFFGWFDPPFPYPDKEDIPIGMTPENTIFIEYLPPSCFGPNSSHQTETLAVMHFSWKEGPIDQLNSYYQATQPTSENMWSYTNRDTINDLITRR